MATSGDPKIQQKKERSPELCPPSHWGGIGKRMQKRGPETVASEGFPRANPLRPANPFSKLLTLGTLIVSRNCFRRLLGHPEYPYPPNSGGDDFPPRNLWGMPEKHCKTRFLKVHPPMNFTSQIWGVWAFRAGPHLR